MASGTQKMITQSSLRSAQRFISTKKPISENVILADALNLLSPSLVRAKPFKPSLFNNLTKGSAHEQYKHDDIMNVKLPTNSNAENYVNNLLVGLQSSTIINKSRYQLLTMSSKDLSTYIKTVTSEEKLFEIIQLFHYQNKLTVRLLTEIVLNRSLVNLTKGPINLINLNEGSIKINQTNSIQSYFNSSKSDISWNDPLNHIQFNIILLKKYHDLKKPLLIIKNLKEHFNSQYLPLIKSKKLSPFYERIIWKFNFEYIKQFDEMYYISNLNSLQSSFLIWESSSSNSIEICKYILENSPNLNSIQKIFLSLCCNPSIDTKLISALKKLSIKYKLYSLPEQPTNESSRLVFYSLVNSMEILMTNDFSKNQELLQTLEDLKNFRQNKLLSKELVSEELRWINEEILVRS